MNKMKIEIMAAIIEFELIGAHGIAKALKDILLEL